MGKAIILWSCLLGLFISTNAQERGAVGTNTQPAPTGKVYALIVGVSKYKEVPSLQYADRDASSFAEFLKSKAGGSVPADNIKVFLDSDATRANVFDELYNLKSAVQPGDLVYFYFAGHGDIEQDLSEGEDALLLLAKSFKKNYLSGSEFIELDKLRNYIGNFSKKGVNVVFIADACHSGAMLSGGQSGRERTLAALEESWSKEIKLLSCQPNEVSEESQKWGNGRGVFSYVLEEGLKGLADTNGDSVITVGEIKRYMESEVPKQTGDAQNPDIKGDPKSKLVHVDMPTLIALREEKQKSLPQMVAMNAGRGDENLLADATPEVKEYYNKFKTALDNGVLLEPKGSSAYDLYNLLNASNAKPELKRIIKRNLVSALEDGAMIFIQNQLSGKKDVDSYNEKVEKEQLKTWQNGIDNLGAAIQILGEDHYLTPSYKARRLYLEAYVLYYKMTTHDRNYTTENLEACIGKLDSAVMFEDNASYAYYLLGDVYAYSGRNDSARDAYTKYLKFNPRDGYAFVNLASLYHRQHQFKQADSLVAVALSVGSDQADEFMNYVAGYYYNLGDQDNAIKYYKQALSYNKDLKSPLLNLGVIYKTRKDYKNAVYYYGRVLQVDSAYAWAYNNLANIYSAENKKDSARRYYEMAIKFDSSYHVAITNLAIQYQNDSNPDLAYKLYHRSKSIEPYYENNYYGIGGILYDRGDYDSAILYYNYCTKLDSTDAKAWYMLGKSYQKTNDTSNAEYYYQQAVLVDTGYAAAWNALGTLNYNRANYPTAVLYYSVAALKDTGEVAYWYNLGKAYHYMDSIDLALLIFKNKVFKLNPKYAAAFIETGTIFYNRSNYDSAEYYYLKGLKYDSLNSAGYYNMGLVKDMKEDYKKAIEYYHKTLKADSTDYKALSAIGDDYKTLEATDSAILYYNRYLNSTKEFDATILNTLGGLYYELGDSINTVATYNRVIEHYRGDVKKAARAYYMSGALYQNRRDYNEATKYYSKIEQDSVYGLYVTIQYAAIEQIKGNFEKAKSFYEDAIHQQPDNAYLLVQYGSFLTLDFKKPLEGRPYLERAVAIDTDNTNSSLPNLAYNYYLAGDTAKAIEYYNMALKKTPTDQMSPYNLACLYSLMKENAKAISYFELSLKNGYTNFAHIKEDTDLDNIRNDAKFIELMKKYNK